MLNIERITEEMQELEIPAFTNAGVDKEYLQLPQDLTVLPTAEISKYLNSIVQQRVYVRTVLGNARAVYREAKSDFDKTKLKVFALLPPRMSVTEKELRVFENEEAEEARKFMEYALEKFDYLKDVLQSLEDLQFLLSRELSRRLKDFEDVNRAGKFNT